MLILYYLTTILDSSLLFEQTIPCMCMGAVQNAMSCTRDFIRNQSQFHYLDFQQASRRQVSHAFDTPVTLSTKGSDIALRNLRSFTLSRSNENWRTFHLNLPTVRYCIHPSGASLAVINLAQIPLAASRHDTIRYL